MTATSAGAAALFAVLATGQTATAQDLEPRVYIASPVNSNVVVAAVSRSTGAVISDATAPVDDVSAIVGGLAFAYYRSLGLFGRSASIGATFPIVRARGEGTLNGVTERVERIGAGDMPLRFTINLAGSPAMDTPTFARRGLHPEVGFSLSAKVPTGQYDGTRLVNIGANRWAMKPELGVSLPIGPRWRVDAYGGVWWFTRNDDFRSTTRKQSPLFSTQAHLSFNLSRQGWAALDATFYTGGRTTTGDVTTAEREKNSRVGGTLSLPIAHRQSVRIAYSKGAWIRLGSDFQTIGASWNYVWGPGF